MALEAKRTRKGKMKNEYLTVFQGEMLKKINGMKKLNIKYTKGFLFLYSPSFHNSSEIILLITTRTNKVNSFDAKA
jgi:hypothetical protein